MKINNNQSLISINQIQKIVLCVHCAGFCTGDYEHHPINFPLLICHKKLTTIEMFTRKITSPQAYENQQFGLLMPY